MTAATRTTVLVGVAVVVVVLAGLTVPRMLAGEPAPQGPAPDPSAPTLRERLSSTERSPLPDVTLDGFGGAPPVALASYRGSPLVVNLWATWCAPCVEEMPAFDEVARGAGDRVAFLGVDVQDTPRAAEAFVRDLGISYDLAVDPRREFASAIGAFGMPTTLLVDGGGTIVYRHTGPLDAGELRRLLGEHLAVAL